MYKSMPSHLQDKTTSISNNYQSLILPTVEICVKGTPMLDRETNTNISYSLTSTDTPPHKVVTPRVRPEPRDPCTVRIQGVESWFVELHPNSLGFQAILQDGV